MNIFLLRLSPMSPLPTPQSPLSCRWVAQAPQGIFLSLSQSPPITAEQTQIEYSIKC